MASLHVLDIPDELYERLEQLAKAENSSVDAQVITILQNALQTKTQQTEEERRKNVPKLLEEIRLRRESRQTDGEWPDSTALIREDRDR
ncbi:FitA-like ribbon-helix-helix domain-containing protein [Nostoc sp.]|uniref:FitA-like ribbon-helix-helix domain-containing protein n=1 Tax=Nostoc sp. TaxID=1180 RepID=UPI002FFA5155